MIGRRAGSEPTPDPPVTARRAPPSRKRAELVVAFSADAATLDPRLAFNVPAQSISRHLYEPLVHHDVRGHLRPGLATSWCWRDGNRTLDLTLQPGVRFHTGALMTARDVKYTFDTTLSPDTRSRQKPTLFDIADTEILDDLTLRIRTHVPARSLLSTLSLYPLGIVNAASVSESAGVLAPPADGTGPFRCVEYVPGELAVLERSPTYWGRPSRLDRLTIRIVPDVSDRIEALLAGQVLMVNNVPHALIPRIRQTPGLRLAEVVTARSIYGQINLTRPPFQDRRVRIALNYAIDKRQLVHRVLGGHGQVARGLVAPSVQGHEPTMRAWPYDPTRATSLLAQVGYSADAPLALRLIGPAGRFAQDEQVGVAVAEAMAGVGIRVRYRALPESQYTAARDDVEAWDVLLSGWCVHTLEADFLLSRNFDREWVSVGYRNPAVTALLARARAVSQTWRSTAFYRTAQQLIWRDAPWIWLYYQSDVHAVSTRLTGFTARPDEFLLFHTAALAG
jgi:peptide/nickel transport system substrate-binding protein